MDIVQQGAVNKVAYIKGVDGLRAVAVLAVMLFHLDSYFLPGGFSGVDVFFVISGYVVSCSLARSSSSDLFRFILSFYARRIVRIFPALITCLIIVSIVTTLFVPSPSSWLGNANNQTAMTAFFGVSNFYLAWFNGEYFSPRMEFNPFVHTWTLGVEEQFYVIFPFIMFIWIKYRKRKTFLGFISNWLLAVLLVMSLFISWQQTSESPNNAFYLLPSRFWELAFGALLFKFHSRQKLVPNTVIIKQLCLSTGVVLIGLGFILSDKNSFPFPWALLSVGGALFIIAGLVSKVLGARIIVQRLLENSMLVYIGKVSFSLYLWHWPVYVLFRWTIGLETMLEIISAIVLTGVLSSISYNYIESPIRKNKFIMGRPSWHVVSFGVGMVVVSSVFAGTVFMSQSFLSLSVTENREMWYPYNPRSLQAGSKGGGEKIFSGRKLFVYGDSHAGAYVTMLDSLSNIDGVEVYIYSKSGCNLSGLLVPITAKCKKFNERSLSEIDSLSSFGDILFLSSLGMSRIGENYKILNTKEIVSNQLSEESVSNRRLALHETVGLIRRFEEKNIHIIIEAPKPVFISPPFRCSDWFNSSNPICREGAVLARDFLLEHRRPVMDSLDSLARIFPKLIIWDPFPILCKTNTCSSFDENGPLFFDVDHLSGHGNRILLPSFRFLLKETWLSTQQPPAKTDGLVKSE
ncbi:MAG TPA: acyltransferase [Gammaproteobacteria bacterium]|nr:acyltransferase [Gammaproteobacteria bacterium]